MFIICCLKAKNEQTETDEKDALDTATPAGSENPAASPDATGDATADAKPVPDSAQIQEAVDQAKAALAAENQQAAQNTGTESLSTASKKSDDDVTDDEINVFQGM